MDPNARRVLRYLMDYGAHNWTVEEMSSVLRLSKTAIRRALVELEEAGQIQMEEDR